MLFCFGIAAALFFFVGRFLLSALLPFLLGALLASLARRPARRLAKNSRKGVRILAPLFLLLLLVGGTAVLLLGIRRLLREGEALLSGLSQGKDLPAALQTLLGLEQGELNHFATRLLTSVLGELVSLLPPLLRRIASVLPSLLLAFFLTLVSGFYFCLEERALYDRLLPLLPSPLRHRLPLWRLRLSHVTLRYLCAYLLLFLLTLGEMLLGFVLLRVNYAFLLSLLVAAVDLLPVLGAGSVLLPWCIIAFLQGNPPLGLGLLALYLLTLLIRQILEPRILGKSLGISPLASLFASYASYRLFGVVGLLLGPPIALLGKTLLLQFLPEAPVGDPRRRFL